MCHCCIWFHLKKLFCILLVKIRVDVFLKACQKLAESITNDYIYALCRELFVSKNTSSEYPSLLFLLHFSNFDFFFFLFLLDFFFFVNKIIGTHFLFCCCKMKNKPKKKKQSNMHDSPLFFVRSTDHSKSIRRTCIKDHIKKASFKPKTHKNQIKSNQIYRIC